MQAHGRIALPAVALFFAVTVRAQGDFEYPPLADTRWELVTIQSMDDSSWTPEDPSKYTIAFGAHGVRVRLRHGKGRQLAR